MADVLPVASQVKSLVQWISGDSKGALRTQINFSRQCPIVSQVRSAVEACQGDCAAAQETQLQHLQVLGGMVDSLPVAGHVKGIIHYSCGDAEGGHKAVEAATRTIAVVGGGVGGFCVGGVPGAVGGGVAAGAAYDGTATGIASVLHKKYDPHGIVKTCTEAHLKEGAEKSGPIFDAICAILGDGATGYAVGEYLQRCSFSKKTVETDLAPDQHRGLTCMEKEGCAKVYCHSETIDFSRKGAVVAELKRLHPGKDIHVAAGTHGAANQAWLWWEAIPESFCEGKFANKCKNASWKDATVRIYDMTIESHRKAFEAATRKADNVCYISWCHGTDHAWVNAGIRNVPAAAGMGVGSAPVAKAFKASSSSGQKS